MSRGAWGYMPSLGPWNRQHAQPAIKRQTGKPSRSHRITGPSYGSMALAWCARNGWYRVGKQIPVTRNANKPYYTSSSVRRTLFLLPNRSYQPWQG